MTSSWVSTCVLLFCLSIGKPIPTLAWDLELFDLVEEIPQTFYEFLSVDQDASSADIRKAYRRLSLVLHPDKNKDENAETQFRQLVAIYEVLKDEERRQRYNDILVHGLPNWKQPEYYSWRVRKMSNAELGLILCLILTIIHYGVIWAVYFQNLMDEFMVKKKKDRKKKGSSKGADEMKAVGQEKNERSFEKPQWYDILPFKLSIGLYLFVKSLPLIIQEAKQYYEDYKEMKLKEKEEAEALAAEEAQQAQQKEKYPKVKKPKIEFPVYEPSTSDVSYAAPYDQGTSIEDIEDQMDDWLEDKKSQKKKNPDWTDDDISQLSRCMKKFPGGTPGRWEKIAHELGRSITDVTAKAKQVKDNITTTPGMVKLSNLKGAAGLGKVSKVPDALMTQREEPPAAEEVTSIESSPGDGGEEAEGKTLRRRAKKGAAAAAAAVGAGGGGAGAAAASLVVVVGGGGGGGAVEDKSSRSRRQRDFDPNAVEEDSEEERRAQPTAPQKEKEKAGAGAAAAGATEEVWTQNQQKLLEMALQQYPRGTTERWDRIAKVVPGKTKEECMIRFKMLAELIQKRKQAKS